jgi:hypothetical protein
LYEISICPAIKLGFLRPDYKDESLYKEHKRVPFFITVKKNLQDSFPKRVIHPTATALMKW